VKGDVSLSDGILPSIYAYGDHQNVGQKIGQTFSTLIKKSLKENEMLWEIKRWIEFSDEGSATYGGLVDAANNTFPEYVDEIQGMAIGSGVDFQTLMILNLQHELEYLSGLSSQTRFEQKTDHCSDYLVKDEEGRPYIGHNEDGESYGF